MSPYELALQKVELYNSMSEEELEGFDVFSEVDPDLLTDDEFHLITSMLKSY